MTQKDVDVLKENKEEVAIYAGLFAKPVVLTKENCNAVFNYGQRLYVLGRLTNAKGQDIVDEDMD